MENNVFKWDLKTHIFLIDKTGAISGEYLKAMNFRGPKVIEEMKEKVKEYEVGDYFIIRDLYLFIVGRKHYRSKWDKKAVESALQNVFNLDLQFKSVKVDYPEEITNFFTSEKFEWKERYQWPE